jgi:TRAP-type C4-dicarboxylate transport system permease small subunit
MKDSLERWLGTLFGLIFVALSLLVAVETVVRKLFNFSLQGADELGAYSLAICATIAFSLALIGRTHIRVDVFHERLPAWLQMALNWLSAMCMAAFALLLAVLAWNVLQDSRSYQSVSQTPWATPLVYPQTGWVIGLMVFALVAIVSAGHATWLLLRGRSAELNHAFGPRSTKEEVDEELEDLRNRSTDIAPNASTPPTDLPGARA